MVVLHQRDILARRSPTTKERYYIATTMKKLGNAMLKAVDIQKNIFYACEKPDTSQARNVSMMNGTNINKTTKMKEKGQVNESEGRSGPPAPMVVGPQKLKYVFNIKWGVIFLLNAGSVSINTVFPFTAYQRRLGIRIWVERGGDTTIKTPVIASCQSCPTRRRRCHIIPDMVLKQCATSQGKSENSTT